jgi:two-component system phosphate regulon sensor histidine kinase PhoR
MNLFFGLLIGILFLVLGIFILKRKKVYTENIKDYVLIKIEDNGIGMSKAVQKKVFEKFFREHTGDLHNVKGHGLGLAYVKQIIDDHNGEVFVESEKGKGSTFIIKLPLIN